MIYTILLSLLYFFPAAQERVLEIVIEGNKIYSAEEIRGGMYTKVGERLDPKVLQQDVIFLWQNKRIRSEVFEEALPGGVRLIVKVEEIPSIRDVSLRGNQKVKREDLLDAAKLTPGVPIDEVIAVRARGDLIQYYRDQGYFFANVRLNYDKDAGKVIFEIMEGPLVKVSSVEFEGNQTIPQSSFLGLGRSLSSQMKTRGKFLFFASGEFKESTLREDLIQLRRYYRVLGFRDAVVEVRELEFNEEHDRVIVHILVNEGPRYVVSAVDIEGNNAFPKEELITLIHLKPGDYYSAEMVEADRATLTRYYGERGYPDHLSISNHWRFDEPKEVYSSEEAKVKVIYRIDEGKRIKVRDIQVQGNQVTQDRVVRRALRFFPGEYVNTTEIGRSLNRLNSMGYFADERGFPAIRYSFLDTEQPDEKDLAVQVTEGQTGRFNIGAGVNSAEGLFANISLQKTNFDLFNLPSSWGNAFKETFGGTAFTGGGQDLALSLSPGTRISTYNLRFREPDLFGTHLQTTSFLTRLFERQRFFEDHEEDRSGVNFAFGKNWTDNWNTAFNIRDESIKVKDISLDAPQIVFDSEGRNSLRSVGFDISYQNVDLPADPTRGFSVLLTNEIAGGILAGDMDFYKTSFYTRFYLPIYMDDRGRSSTLLLRGSFSIANSYGDSPVVPFPERYFAGGPDSIRGFSLFGVGPVQNDHPVGGEVMGLAGAELRFPLYSTSFADGLAETEWVRGVVFVDSGSLGLDVHDPTFREWRMSAGTGVRIRLPFLGQGQIVLDYGVPIFSQETDSRRNFSFSIGTSF